MANVAAERSVAWGGGGGSLWETPKLHKEGENAPHVCANPPPPLSEILYLLPLHVLCCSSSLDSAGSSSYHHEGRHTWRSPIDKHLKYRDYQNKTVLKKKRCVYKVCRPPHRDVIEISRLLHLGLRRTAP